ncbi:PRD domain-containing protein [Biostraticola tofi]|uniref:PRD domain-containing protein n=2 Tax=Biostraticola tofi TaxID=466109 RepID=A0A4R3YJA9_9GAMM|nr:PRD domain-containing protein [Biostraticola tofi]
MNMSLPSSGESTLSGPQRRSLLLVMLFAPSHPLSLETLAAATRASLEDTLRDIGCLKDELNHIHRLHLVSDSDSRYYLKGTVLNKRICLIEGMRRAIRLCPEKITDEFTGWLENSLQRLPPALQLPANRIDDTVDELSRLLKPNNAGADKLFLGLFLRVLLIECAEQQHPDFNQHQLKWLTQKHEQQIVARLFSDWPLPQAELYALTLLVSLSNTPHHLHSSSDSDGRLNRAVEQVVHRFEGLASMAFRQHEMLVSQLFSHLSAALERCHFQVGIDSSLQEEVEEKYPRLLRTTRAAVLPLEAEYRIRFSREEMGLIAVIFGAWLMQESDIQEKQLLILTRSQGVQEKKLELQIRELTLLPLNIRFQSVEDFQSAGAPKNTRLVITTFALPLPLFSPPLVHVRLPLGQAQQQRIRQLLEN